MLSQIKKAFGELFCLLGWHDWYEGVHLIYCCREDCDMEIERPYPNGK